MPAERGAGRDAARGWVTSRHTEGRVEDFPLRAPVPCAPGRYPLGFFHAVRPLTVVPAGQRRAGRESTQLQAPRREPWREQTGEPHKAARLSGLMLLLRCFALRCASLTCELRVADDEPEVVHPRAVDRHRLLRRDGERAIPIKHNLRDVRPLVRLLAALRAAEERERARAMTARRVRCQGWALGGRRRLGDSALCSKSPSWTDRSLGGSLWWRGSSDSAHLDNEAPGRAACGVHQIWGAAVPPWASLWSLVADQAPVRDLRRRYARTVVPQRSRGLHTAVWQAFATQRSRTSNTNASTIPSPPS